NPVVAYKDADGRVTASWIEANAINYRHSTSPYQAADWKTEATLYSTGTNTDLSISEHQSTGDLPIFWNSGNANPYTISVELIDMSTAPSVVISSGATDPTNTSPIPVTFQFSTAVTGFVIGDI